MALFTNGLFVAQLIEHSTGNRKAGLLILTGGGEGKRFSLRHARDIFFNLGKQVCYSYCRIVLIGSHNPTFLRIRTKNSASKFSVRVCFQRFAKEKWKLFLKS